MNKYLGITIGPIIKTFSTARKPRELWKASYMFSYLMQMLLQEFKNEGYIKIISPGIEEIESFLEVGTYPDRMFCCYPKDKDLKITKIKEGVITKCAEDWGIQGKDVDAIKEYLKIYSVEIIRKENENPITLLNQLLDYLELENFSIDGTKEETFKEFLFKISTPKIFETAMNSSRFTVPTLAEISSAQLRKIDGERYTEIKRNYPFAYNGLTLGKELKQLLHEKQSENSSGEPDENKFLSDLKKKFSKEFKTPHKYICVVYADGDNVGKYVNSLKLEDKENEKNELTAFSDRMLTFGVGKCFYDEDKKEKKKTQGACDIIQKYQGFPIYAGGDDLLFIAPVISGIDGGEKDEKGNAVITEKTIFDLLKEIDSIFEKLNLVSKDGVSIPTMSYGIAIVYHKFPLYEALNHARYQLFEVAKKKEKQKDAVAWIYQKNSGSSVSGSYSKSNEYLVNAFDSLLKSIDPSDGNMENLISAVAHKLKQNIPILALMITEKHQRKTGVDNDRLSAFFDMTLDRPNKKKKELEYLNAVEYLLKALLQKHDYEVEPAINDLYGMLRTAKFVKGLEDDKDE